MRSGSSASTSSSAVGAVARRDDLVAARDAAPPRAGARSPGRRRRRGSSAGRSATHRSAPGRPGSARRRRPASRGSRRSRPRGIARGRRSSPARSAPAPGSTAVRSSRRSRASASTPSMPGSWMSISTSAGSCVSGELDRVLARGRLERAVARGLQHVAEELHVLLVVLDDEDPLTGHSALLLDREREDEAAAVPGLALDPDPAAVQLDEALREREPEPGALALLAPRRRSAGTPRRSAPGPRARCPARCRSPTPAPRRRPAPTATTTLPPSGVNLTAFESRLKITWRNRRSSPSTRSTSGAELEREPDAVLRRPLAHHHDAALERLAQRERGDLELDLPGLDLRQVEHVVDQRQQVVAGREDVVEVLLLLLVDLAEQPLPQHLREADDRVQRRPQLVRHVGQEVGSCARSRPRAGGPSARALPAPAAAPACVPRPFAPGL